MRTKNKAHFVLFSIVSLLASGSYSQQNTVLPDYPNNYTMYENLVKMPDNRSMGSGNAIDVDSQGNIWVFERCGGNQGSCSENDVDPVLKFSPDGEVLTSFGAGMFVWPHGIVVDDDDNLWIIDAGVIDGEKGNQIFKFSQNGEILIELGQPGIRGDSQDLFNEPSDLAIGADGSLYVIDGHISPESNHRVLHLTSEGDYIEEWGSQGYGPLEFEGLHAIAVDSQGKM